MEAPATGTTGPSGTPVPHAGSTTKEAAPTGSEEGGEATSGSAQVQASAAGQAPEVGATSAASASIPVGGEPAEAEETRVNGLLDGLKIIAENTAQKNRAERLAVGQAPVVFDTADSPACTDCGSIMVRNGSCYKCINCGATSGCS